MSPTSSLVPVIDIAGWAGRTEDARAAIAAAVDDACRRVGFFQVIGHGVAPEVIAAMQAALDAFYALPLEAKLATRPPKPGINRGYTGVGAESVSYSIGEVRPPDLFEAFNIGVGNWVDGDPYYEAERDRFFARNIWPADMPELEPPVVSYFAVVQDLALRVDQILARALGLADDFFDGFTDRSIDVLRTLRYERAPGAPEPLDGQMRLGAHTDFGITTMLYADPVPGLQVLGAEGHWHDVIPEPGAFIVNLGDALAIWTNDQWRSTLHRVVPPPTGETGGFVRRSYAFFHDGNIDARIECLPGCTTPDDPPRYSPVTMADHLIGKILAPRLATTSVAGSVQTAAGRVTA